MEYVRIVLKAHFMALYQNGTGLNESGIVLQRFHSHVKQFILICGGVGIAAKLRNSSIPRKERPSSTSGSGKLERLKLQAEGGY
jgi:hypothetical protein